MKPIKDITKKDWIKAGCWGTLYVIFVIWVAWGDWASLGWLALLPVVIDAFTTKVINWSWWRQYKPADKDEEPNPKARPVLYKICSWVDAIVFALVAVYYIQVIAISSKIG